MPSYTSSSFKAVIEPVSQTACCREDKMLAKRCSVQCSATVDRRQALHTTVERPPQQRRRFDQEQKNKLRQFSTHWLPRLLDTQTEINDNYTKVASFGERLAAEVGKAQSRLSEVMQGVLAPFHSDLKEKGQISRSHSPLLDALQNPARLRQLASADGLPDELSGIVAQIQATNQTLRVIEQDLQELDSKVDYTKVGAEQRDQQTLEYRDALLQLAEDLEQQELEEAARAAELARWEAEQAQIAEERRRAEEAAREEQLRCELAELVAAASAVQATQAGLAVAGTCNQALKGAPPIKVEVGVQLQTKLGQHVMLVGSHPNLGSWSLDGAVRMSWTDGHVWKASIELPADSMELEYKAVLCSSDGKVAWEKGTNHKADLVGSSDVSLYHVFQH